jgi:PLP dependent protein
VIDGRAPAVPPPVDVVSARLARLRERIEAAGRDPHKITVVAVTKGFPAAAVQAVRAAGIDDIGENYATELVGKAELVDKAELVGEAGRVATADEIRAGARGQGRTPRWHYLGAIQRRRVRDLAPVVSCWQSVARPEEGQAIAARAPGAEVFVQVEVSGLPGRNGVPVAVAPGLVAELRGLGLAVRGLMAIAPPGPQEVARAAFASVRAAARDAGVDELSMGMSGDLDVALREGATMLRVGRGLLGPRPVLPG